MKRPYETRAIRAALAPDDLSDFACRCHVASVRLVEASETEGTILSTLWRRARVARGRHTNVPVDHSWVVVDDERIVDVTLWYYDRSVEAVHRTAVNDPAYQEVPPRDRQETVNVWGNAEPDEGTDVWEHAVLDTTP